MHASQKETEQTKDYSIFEYHLIPTIEFKQELLSMGTNVEVLAPQKLRDEIKDDIRITQRRIVSNANLELIMLYFRIGKFIAENNGYGKNFINILAMEFKIAFPKMKGFSSRNLSRMFLFYKEYKDMANLPTVLANLPWSYNYGRCY